MVKVLIMQDKGSKSIGDTVEELSNTVTESSTWEMINTFLNKHVDIGEHISISILDVLAVVTAIFITTVVLRLLLRLFSRNLEGEEKNKFIVVFGYFRWLIYLIIFLATMHSVGVNVNAVFAASAALLIGVGLALQTLFQDIISGVFILVDQSLHVGDIIEIEGKIGRVEEVKLRTTRAVTIDNKVLIVPNHLYLTNSLYNWTQNGTTTRENVSINVAYGSDVELVKKLLIEAALTSPLVFKHPEPAVVFEDFGDNGMHFKVVITIEDSFNARVPKSEVRFAINRLFKANNIIIPFPQRDIHIKQNESNT